MKLLPALLLLSATAQAHCTPHGSPSLPIPLHCTIPNHFCPPDKFPRLILNSTPESSDWLAVRKTKTTNSRDNGAVSDVNSPDMRCFGGSTPGKAVATVAAGDTLGFVASSGIMHFGPCQFYMARVPEGQDVSTWDAAGNVWFKAGSISAVVKPGGGALKGDEATWPAYRTSVFASLLFFVLSCAWYWTVVDVLRAVLL